MPFNKVDKVRIKTNVKLSQNLFLVVAAIIFLLIAFFPIKNSISDEYVQIIGFVFGSMFGIFGLGSLLSIFCLENLVFENELLKIISIRGKVKREIKTKEIESYMEIVKENKYSKWRDLTIFTRDSKYTISSYIYSDSDYKLLKKSLTKGKKANLFAEKMWHYKIERRYGIGFMIFEIVFLLLFCIFYQNKDVKILQSQLATVEGTVENEIKEKVSSRRKSTSRYIELKFEEYPKFKFRLAGFRLDVTKKYELMADVHKGDKIEIDILNDQYQKKFIKTVPLEFWDKYDGYRNISIYGLRYKQKDYFDLIWFNRIKIHNNNSIFPYFFLLFSLGLIGYGFYEFTKIKNPGHS